MSDYIDRKAAIDAVMDLMPSLTTADGSGQFDAEIYRAQELFVDIGQVLADLPPAERWTPCAERLPEDRAEEYWVCTDAGEQHTCRWTNANPVWTHLKKGWHWNIFDIPQYSKVVAWRPLPEPYREDPEPTMEEFMQGQDPGDPRDGRL